MRETLNTIMIKTLTDTIDNQATVLAFPKPINSSYLTNPLTYPSPHSNFLLYCFSKPKHQDSPQRTLSLDSTDKSNVFDSFLKKNPNEEFFNTQDRYLSGKVRIRMPLKIHGRNRIYKTKLSILKNFCVTLTFLFEGTPLDPSNRFQFTYEQLKLLQTIVIKKFHITSSNLELFKENANQTQFFDNIESVRRCFISQKRTEENIKFVYKHTLKYMKSKFYDKNNFRYNKESEVLFYRHYFGFSAMAGGIDLQEFYDPLNSNYNGKKKGTISNSHLTLLFSCESFREEFFRYVRNEFKKDYQSSIYKKIERMFLKLESELDKHGDEGKSEIINKFNDKLKRQKKTKLPWSSQEIDTAISCFRVRLNKLNFCIN